VGGFTLMEGDVVDMHSGTDVKMITGLSAYCWVLYFGDAEWSVLYCYYSDVYPIIIGLVLNGTRVW
jgi:hypothetical protein